MENSIVYPYIGLGVTFSMGFLLTGYYTTKRKKNERGVRLEKITPNGQNITKNEKISGPQNKMDTE